MVANHDEIIRAIGEVKAEVAGVSGKVDAVAANVGDLKKRSTRDSERINSLEESRDKVRGAAKVVTWLTGSGAIAGFIAWAQQWGGKH